MTGKSASPESDEPLHVEATVHGRVLIQPASGTATGGLLLVFHGYAEDAGDGLRGVQGIPGLSSWTVVSVQALHPFYRGRSGQVVASWMTRQDRDLAIEDNLRYVDRVVGKVRTRLGGSDSPLVYCGFSQGAAMAWRAAAMLDRGCEGLIVLGGDVPPELKTLRLDSLPAVLLGRGRDEQAYSKEQMELDLALLAEKGVTVTACEYAGGHEWTDEFRARCGAYLETLTSRKS